MQMFVGNVSWVKTGGNAEGVTGNKNAWPLICACSCGLQTEPRKRLMPQGHGRVTPSLEESKILGEHVRAGEQ